MIFIKLKKYFRRFLLTIAILAITFLMSLGTFLNGNPEETTQIYAFADKSGEFSKTIISTYRNLIKGTQNETAEKQVSADEIFNSENEERYVAIGGELIGIELYTKGITVIGTETFEGVSGTVSPASDAGIQNGDVITQVNGIEITDKNVFTQQIKNSNGNTLSLTVQRENETIDIQVKPVKSSVTGIYKAGIWIKDSTGGIGTLTYYDTANATVAALGHAVFKTDTNEPLNISYGNITAATFVDIEKGVSGKAGQIFASPSKNILGTVEYNNDKGIFGYLTHCTTETEYYPVASADDIKTGPAEILCTVSENGKKSYGIEILKINSDSGKGKDMTIEITDSELLDITGGIIQGMSGSPIIQNGKFVGAVTHVFLNNPKCGYGIFAEEMLNITDGFAELSDNAA